MTEAGGRPRGAGSRSPRRGRQAGGHLAQPCCGAGLEVAEGSRSPGRPTRTGRYSPGEETRRHSRRRLEARAPPHSTEAGPRPSFYGERPPLAALSREQHLPEPRVTAALRPAPRTRGAAAPACRPRRPCSAHSEAGRLFDCWKSPAGVGSGITSVAIEHLSRRVDSKPERK